MEKVFLIVFNNLSSHHSCRTFDNSY